MEIDVEYIDKDNYNTWRNIYNAIQYPYYEGVEMFLIEFPEHCKNNPNVPQNIPSKIKNKLKILFRSNILFADGRNPE